jgi:hypothetical protein
MSGRTVANFAIFASMFDIFVALVGKIDAGRGRIL